MADECTARVRKADPLDPLDPKDDGVPTDEIERGYRGLTPEEESMYGAAQAAIDAAHPPIFGSPDPAAEPKKDTLDRWAANRSEDNNARARESAEARASHIFDADREAASRQRREGGFGPGTYAGAGFATAMGTMASALPMLYEGALGIMGGRPMGIAGTVVSLAAAGIQPMVDSMMAPGAIVGTLRQGADLSVAAETGAYRYGVRLRDLRRDGFDDFARDLRGSFDRMDDDRRRNNPGPSRGEYNVASMTSEELSSHFEDITRALADTENRLAQAEPGSAEYNRQMTRRAYLLKYSEGIEKRAETITAEAKQYRRDLLADVHATNALARGMELRERAAKEAEESRVKNIISADPVLRYVKNTDMARRILDACTDPSGNIVLDPSKMDKGDMDGLKNILEHARMSMENQGVSKLDPGYVAVNNVVEAIEDHRRKIEDDIRKRKEAADKLDHDKSVAKYQKIYDDLENANDFATMTRLEVLNVGDMSEYNDALALFARKDAFDRFGMFKDKDKFNKYMSKLDQRMADAGDNPPAELYREWQKAHGVNEYYDCMKALADLPVGNDPWAKDQYDMAMSSLQKMENLLTDDPTNSGALSFHADRVRVATGKKLRSRPDGPPSAFPLGKGVPKAIGAKGTDIVYGAVAGKVRDAVSRKASLTASNRVVAWKIQGAISAADVRFNDAVAKLDKKRKDIGDAAYGIELYKLEQARNREICAIVSTREFELLDNGSARKVQRMVSVLSNASFNNVGDKNARAALRTSLGAVVAADEGKVEDFVKEVDKVLATASIPKETFLREALGPAYTGIPSIDYMAIKCGCINPVFNPVLNPAAVPGRMKHLTKDDVEGLQREIVKVFPKFFPVKASASYGGPFSAGSIVKYTAIDLRPGSAYGKGLRLNRISDEERIARLRDRAREQWAYKRICLRLGMPEDSDDSADFFLLTPPSMLERQYNIHDEKVLDTVERFQAYWTGRIPCYRDWFIDADFERVLGAPEDDYIRDSYIDTTGYELEDNRRLTEEGIGSGHLPGTRFNEPMSPPTSPGEGLRTWRDVALANLERAMLSGRPLKFDKRGRLSDDGMVLGDRTSYKYLKAWYAYQKRMLGMAPEDYAADRMRTALTLLNESLSTYKPSSDPQTLGLSEMLVGTGRYGEFANAVKSGSVNDQLSLWKGLVMKGLVPAGLERASNSEVQAVLRRVVEYNDRISDREKAIGALEGALADGSAEALSRVWGDLRGNRGTRRVLDAVTSRGTPARQAVTPEIVHTMAGALTLLDIADAYKQGGRRPSAKNASRRTGRMEGAPDYDLRTIKAYNNYYIGKLFPKKEEDKEYRDWALDFVKGLGYIGKVKACRILSQATPGDRDALVEELRDAEVLTPEDTVSLIEFCNSPDCPLKTPFSVMMENLRGQRKAREKEQALENYSGKKRKPRGPPNGEPRKKAPKKNGASPVEYDEAQTSEAVEILKSVLRGDEPADDEDALRRAEVVSLLMSPLMMKDTENGRAGRRRDEEYFENDSASYVLRRMIEDLSPKDRLAMIMRIYSVKEPGSTAKINMNDVFSLYGFDRPKVVEQDDFYRNRASAADRKKMEADEGFQKNMAFLNKVGGFRQAWNSLGRGYKPSDVSLYSPEEPLYAKADPYALDAAMREFYKKPEEDAGNTE